MNASPPLQLANSIYNQAIRVVAPEQRSQLLQQAQVAALLSIAVALETIAAREREDA